MNPNATAGPNGIGYVPFILPQFWNHTLNDEVENLSMTVQNLTPGVHYDFCLFTRGFDPNVEEDWERLPLTPDDQDTLSKGSSATTGGTAVEPAPAAPSGLKATWGVPKEPGVFLHWINQPNNETAYKIYRFKPGTTFDPNNPVQNGALIGATGPDGTSFDYASADPKTDMMYAVVAMKGTTPSAAATAEATPPEIIALIRGDDSSNPLVNLVHESVAIGRFVNGKFAFTVAFTFGVEGQNPQNKTYPAKNKWLWWNIGTPAGQFLPGIVYKQTSLGKPIFTIVAKKIVTHAQEEKWRNTMLNRLGLHDIYQVGAYDCTVFSNKVFAEAPGQEG